MHIVLIGLGQSLRRDDGAGLKAVQEWLKKYPNTASHPLLRIEILELPGLGLLDLIYHAGAAIIVDAVQSGSKPGKLHLTMPSEVSDFDAGSGSAHGLGVAEVLALGRQISPELMPEKIIFVGIEGENFDMGDHLSAAVKKSMPEVVDHINQLVLNLLSELEINPP